MALLIPPHLAAATSASAEAHGQPALFSHMSSNLEPEDARIATVAQGTRPSHFALL